MAGTVALIVAAGRGVRAGGEIPKQYREIGGVPVLRRTIGAFLSHPEVDQVLVAIAPGDSRYADVAPQNERSLLPPVIGGETRQESVRLGLESLAGLAPDRVLIHDGARPFVSAAVISRVVAALDARAKALGFQPQAQTLEVHGLCARCAAA